LGPFGGKPGHGLFSQGLTGQRFRRALEEKDNIVPEDSDQDLSKRNPFPREIGEQLDTETNHDKGDGEENPVANLRVQIERDPG
jgi:hypothetical protein